MSFTRVCSLDDIAEDGALHVEIGELPVAIVRTGDELFAIEDVCSHAEVPLSEGEIEGTTIECWLHGSRFDLRTGEPTGPPATVAVPVYPVRVDGSDVLIDSTDTREN